MAAAILVDPCIKRRERLAWLMEGAAETGIAFTVAGQAPRGVMLLGAIQSIAQRRGKVKVSPSSKSRKDRKWSQVPTPRCSTARNAPNSASEEYRFVRTRNRRSSFRCGHTVPGGAPTGSVAKIRGCQKTHARVLLWGIPVMERSPVHASSEPLQGRGGVSKPRSCCCVYSGTCVIRLRYRHLEEMMGERRLRVDHITISRWVQYYAPELDRRCRQHLKATTDSADRAGARSGKGERQKTDHVHRQPVWRGRVS